MTIKKLLLRKRILIPVALAFMVILGLIIATNYYLQQLHIDKASQERLLRVEKSLPLFIEDDALTLETALDSIAKEPLLRQAWLTRNRTALLLASTPYFEDIRSRLKVTHFYFIEPDSTCFLRVHQPSRHGDTIKRITLARATESGHLASGLELGPLGTITFRVVKPWLLEGKIIGYLELGVELSQILPKIQETMGLKILAVIEKNKLERTSWEQGRRMLNLPAEWDRFKHVVVSSEDVEQTSKEMNTFINAPHLVHRRQAITFTHKGQTICAGQMPLTDVGGVEIGGFFVLFDISEEMALLSKMLWNMVFIALLASGFFGLGFFLFVGKIEQRLNQTSQALQDESDSHQRTANELRIYKENLEEMVLAQTEALHVMNRSLQDEVVLRKEAEKNSLDALTELEQIFSASVSGMQVVDKNHQVLRFNPAFTELFGISLGEDNVKTCYENISCPLVNGPECCAQQILDGKTEVEVEMEIARRDGSKIWVLHTAAPFYDATGKLQGMVQNFSDITERKRAELEIREANEKWERTFAAMGDIVTLHDENMHIVRANKAAGEALGLASEKLIGRYCYDVFRGEALPCQGCPETKARHDYRLHSAEIEHANLGKTFLVSASPVLNDQGKFCGVVHVAKDITEQKKLEAQFRQSQKMEAIGTLSGGVAHDFNNILTGILGFAGLAKMEMPPGTQLYEDIVQIIDQGKRGADLVRQLMAFSRHQNMELSVLNLNDLIANISKMIRRLIGENIEYTFSPCPNPVMVQADAGQMEQILVNLAVNARDAMLQGGNLTVETDKIVLDEEYVCQHLGMTQGEYVMLAISDTGCGMDQGTLEKIFEPFFTTKELGKGTGLGLATVYGIVKQHRGNILVDSEPGHGTTFKIYLPASTTDEKQSESQPQNDLPATPLGTEVILLVEDEDPVRFAVARMLEIMHYTVLVAADPDEAEKVFTEHPEIDMLLTDLVMPKRNGKELYDILHSLRPALKVLFMSGYTDKTVPDESVGFIQQSFIQKPFTTEQLAHKVREVLAQTEQTES